MGPRLKQIDLEPKEYRAQPIKGEPALVPGALRRVAFYIVFALVSTVAGLALVVTVKFAESWFADLWSLIFR